MSKRSKTILLGALAAVAMLIPTYIAIANYAVLGSWQNTLTGPSAVLTVQDDEGATVFSGTAGETTNRALAQALADMLKVGSPVRQAPTMTSADIYTVKVKTTGKERTYLCYYSTADNDSYLVDVDGNVCYAVDNTDMLPFLQGFFYGETRESLSVPTLTTAGNEVTPSYISWYHKNGQGSFGQVLNLATASEEQTYPVNKNIALRFSTEPDSATVKIYNGSVEIYNGDYDDFAGLSYTDTVNLTVKIQAKWEKSATSDYYGEASYQFYVNYSAKPAFTISNTVATVGDYLVINVLNAAAPEDITFTSSPDIGYTPVFYEDGDYVRALVPLHVDLTGGTYRLTVSTKGAEETFAVTLEERSTLTRTYDANSTLIGTARSAAALAEYQNLLDEIGKQPSATKYFSGQFVDYRDSTTSIGAILFLGYGHTRTLTTTGESYRMDGADFFIYKGIDIPALNNGMVIATGSSAYLGNYVIVDHGLGLRTWYSHLSEIAVSVGDTVKTAQAVGKSGDSGFTTSPGVYLMCTIGNVQISPYTLWSDGVIY